MKAYSSCILLLLFTFSFLVSKAQISTTTLTKFHTPNAKTDAGVTVSQMLHMDFGAIFNMRADLTGGIIGDINEGGQVKVEVYSYDEASSDGKGELIYGIYIDRSSANFSAKTWNQLVEIVLEPEGNYAVQAKSDEIKKLLQSANIYKPGDACKSYAYTFTNAFKLLGNSLALFTLWVWNLDCKEYFYGLRIQPVIIEASVDRADFKKVKIPGIGEWDAKELFVGTTTFADVEHNISICSHRGYWQDIYAPENTRNSIRDLFVEKYDMVELDLTLTSDNQVVVYHDMGLNKRTEMQGAVRAHTWGQIKDLQIKNRFQELVNRGESTKIQLLSDMLDYIINEEPANSEIFLNLDRSANDMQMFKAAYQIVSSKNLLNRTIFKGRFVADPPAGDVPDEQKPPTVENIQTAFREMFPSLTPGQLNDKIKYMRFTPVLFDNNKDEIHTNDEAFAQKVKSYIDDMINAGIADGFELTYKAYPPESGYSEFENPKIENTFLLRKWRVLGDELEHYRNFVEYIHFKGLPVGIFASVPEVCAIPDFNADGTRNPNNLVSGFIKETIYPNIDTLGFGRPKMQDQKLYDFRGDWDFYIPAGADYIITDRPDALRKYLEAIGRSRPKQ